MKKVLSVLLAGAMVAGMSVSAFAAKPIEIGTIYDSDGVKNDDVKDSSVTWSFDKGIALEQSLEIDGVVPNAELYVPLAKSNGASYQIAKTPDAAAITNAKAAAAAAVEKKADDVTVGTTVLADEKLIAQTPDSFTEISDIKSAKGAADGKAETGFKYYKETTTELEKIYNETYNASVGFAYNVPLKYLTDKDYFKFDVDKDEGSKYVSKIEIEDDRRLGDLERTAYLKIKLNDSTTTSDLKATGTITFKAKKSASDAKVAGVWENGDTFHINYTFWINNKEVKGDDGEADTGERVFFKPSSNENNTLIWGDDRAALFFEGNDDASKFYARLSTKSNAEIYSTYGDPVNADLWFYDFVGSATIPSTSRATLTLGIPWDDDDDYTPKAEDCFIYEVDVDGNLVDVTSKFTFDSDNDNTTGIEGWTIKTRTLGTYIISDTELDTTVVDEVEETEEPAETTEAPASTGKEIPNTGSSDMVGAAVVAAVVSLAAAGAVAFKKASK